MSLSSSVSQDNNNNNNTKVPPKPQRPSILGLWKAHSDGVAPKQLLRFAESITKNIVTAVMHTKDTDIDDDDDDKDATTSNNKACQASNNQDDVAKETTLDDDEPARFAGATIQNSSATPWNSPCTQIMKQTDTASDDGDADDNIPSDEELRPQDQNDDDSDDSASSWGDDQHWDNYDTWDVLKDEYATDFGFSFDAHGMVKVNSQDDDDDQNVFIILGTSADDPSCQPHVLSPPLMDSLMTFLPPQLHNENYWLKFSLIRDGASLQTLKRYVRAAAFTIVAIETTKGEVFGSFTSHSWRNQWGFYGSQPAFVWKMRHSRRTKVSSLFDQAQLESEIDIFMHTGGNDYVQVCHHDFLAVGGDHALPFAFDGGSEHNNEKKDYAFSSLEHDGCTLCLDDLPDRNGFALTLEDDLLKGTTSPSMTFKNPALCGKADATETFDVAGLEVWTFTPARTVDAAERLEMTKYFVEQSSQNVSAVDQSTSSTLSSSQLMNGKDFSQKDFYRRVGEESDGH